MSFRSSKAFDYIQDLEREKQFDALEAFLTHVLPREEASVRADIIFRVVSSKSMTLEALNVYVKALSGNKDFATRYCLKNICEGNTDPDVINHIKTLTPGLGDQFGQVLALAIQSMHLLAAQALSDANPYYSAPLIAHNGEHFTIDGHACAYSEKPLSLTQADEKILHDLILKRGFGDLLKDHVSGRQYLNRSFKEKRCDDRSFQADIPLVKSGKLVNPELAIVASQRPNSAMTAKVPFLIHKNDAPLFPNATTLSRQAMLGVWDDKSIRRMSATALTVEDVCNIEFPRDNICFGIGYVTESVNHGTLGQDILLASLMLNQEVQMGFVYDDDHLIAIDTPQALLKLPSDDISVDSIEYANAYFDNFFSLELQLQNNLKAQKHLILTSPKRLGPSPLDSLEDVFEAIHSDTIADAAKKTYPESFWKGLYKSLEEKESPTAALHMLRHFGLRAEDVYRESIRFANSKDKIDYLFDHHYEISGKGWSPIPIRGLHKEFANNDKKVLPFFHKLIKMGGWPFNHESNPPKADLNGMMKVVTGLKKVDKLNPYFITLQAYDGPVLLEAAKTDKQYQFIIDHYPEKITGNEDKIPTRLRRPVIESDLGL